MILLETSAVVDMVRRTEMGTALIELAMRNEKKISCDLLRAEAANVFRKLTRTEGLSASEAERYYSESLALVDEFYPLEDLQSEAFRESVRLNHSTYDMFYFVLARRTSATLFTLDRRLMELCLENGVDCVQELG